jgi:CPA2 family monovalent cation:H+ antiporter-2
MSEQSPLIATIVVALVLAFVFGAVANRLRVSPLVGYVLAGVAVGPYTPGFVADPGLAFQLADLGVILLMFGVGLHFSLKDLLAVQKIAVPAALTQIALVVPFAMGLAWAMGWTLAAGAVLGVSLAVASTVVQLRAMSERHLLDSSRGRIAVGWLIVEDLVMVVALVLLPPLAEVGTGDGLGTGFGTMSFAIVVTLAKVLVFVALMLLVGRRVIPWILHFIAHSGSRELFRLSVLAVALGVAYAASELFGVSFALGAFFAGMVMSESQLAQEAAEQTLPLRDAFAVLFFVSVGMLFAPSIVLEAVGPLIAVVMIVIAKALASYAVMRALRQPVEAALTVAAGRAQIGEFSFIFIGLAVTFHVIPELGRELIVAGAVISILINPLAFQVADWLRPRLAPPAPEPEPEKLPRTGLTGHVVLVGYGRVGRVVGEACRARGERLLVIEYSEDLLQQLRAAGADVLPGQAQTADLIEAANVAAAKLLVVAIPNSFEAGQYVERARSANPALTIVARAHSEAEVDYLRKLGANEAILGETEIAQAMIAKAFSPA